MTILTIKGHDSLLVSLKMNSGSLNIIFIHVGANGRCGGESKFLKYFNSISRQQWLKRSFVCLIFF